VLIDFSALLYVQEQDFDFSKCARDPLRHNESFGVRMDLIPSQEEDERLSNAYDETRPDIEEFMFWKT
jgi:hypothetical protein